MPVRAVKWASVRYAHKLKTLAQFMPPDLHSLVAVERIKPDAELAAGVLPESVSLDLAVEDQTPNRPTVCVRAAPQSLARDPAQVDRQ